VFCIQGLSFRVELEAAAAEDGGGAPALGVYLTNQNDGMMMLGVPAAIQLSAQRATTPGSYSFEAADHVTGMFGSLGWADFLGAGDVSGPSDLAPFLVDGALRLRVSVMMLDGVAL
jgi:hypothetical protein